MKQEVKFQIDEVIRENGTIEYTVTVPITWKPILWRLFNFNKYSRVFTISPAKISTARLISLEAKKLPNKLIGNNPTELALDNSDIYQHNIVYIVAAAIQNNGKAPSSALVKFIAMNLNTLWLSEALAVSIKQLQLREFINALILIKGTASILHPAEDENIQISEEPLNTEYYVEN